MSIILHHKDPSNITKPDRYDVSKNKNLLDWMCEMWTDSEEMSSGLSVSVLLNGKEIFRTDDGSIDESLLDFTIGDSDCISIINRPAAAVIGAGASIAASAVSLLVASLIPSLPGDAGEQSQSPNNLLQAASNSFRPNEATPEIFGSVVSFPDFLQPSYFEYINNLRVVYELGYIGEGKYKAGEIRNGETPFSNIPGSSSQIFQPNEMIPSELLTIHRAASTIDGQVLLAPDDESIQQEEQIDTITGGTTTNILLTMVEGSTVVTDLSLAVGGYVSLNLGPLGLDVTPTIGTFDIVNLSIVAERTVIEINSMADISEAPSAISVASTSDSGLINSYIGYFDIPGSTANEVWINWQMPQGIRTEDGKQLSIVVEFQIELLDDNQSPTGTVFTKTEVVTGSTLDPQFRTTKFTAAEFPGMSSSQYRARSRRVTEASEGAASDQVKLEQYVSVTPYDSLDNSTGTVISWQRRATVFATSSSGDKNNLDVVRMLPTYNRVTGVYDINDLQETRSFADAVAYTLIAASGRSESTVDLAGLYEIADNLPHTELGYFDFTFDNKNVGLGGRIESICNVARVSPFKSGGVWGFTRDEEKPIRTAMFNRRVTVGNSSKQSYLLQRPDDKDSVELSYVDPVLNVEKILYRRVDENGDIVSNGAGNQALEIKLAGCRNFFQAWNRINLEMRRIIYQRRTVTDTVLRDGMLVGLLERVGWVDPNDVDSFSGELMSFSGDTYETSERFEPIDGEDYVVYITDDQGNTSNTVAATARADTEFGFIASGLSGAFLAESSGNQLGSRYFIVLESDIAASDFLLTTRKPQSDGSTNIELVEYVPEMYELDDANPPQQSVILPSDIMSTSAISGGDDSTSTITVSKDGTVSASGGFSSSYIATPSADIGVSFEVRLTYESGEEINGSALNEWISLSEDRAWSITKDGATEGGLFSTATLEIRDSSFTENIGISTVSLSASVVGPVSLPSTINVFSFGFNAPASARIRFLSNGTYTTLGNSSSGGNYVDTSSGIGSQYEIMASINSGDSSDLSGNPLDVWINLGGSPIEWSVSASEGFSSADADLTVQIRSISNVADISSSNVTLTAESEL